MTAISDNKQYQIAPSDDATWSQMRIRLWIASAFALLFVTTLLIIAPQIQQRLDRQTKDRLTQAGINTATLEFDWRYRNLTVSGYLPEGVTPGRLAMIMRGSSEQPSALFARGIRHLRLDLDEDPVAGIAPAALPEEHFIEVTTDGSDATLTGVVQDDAQRNTLVQAMLASGAENVFDNLEVLSVPATQTATHRVDALAGILQQLGPVKTHRSEIRLNDQELYYRVTATDRSSAIAIEKAASVEIANLNVRGGVELVSDRRLNLVIGADGEQITLNGIIYSEAQRKRLVFAASEAVGEQQVVDNLTIADGVSEAPELLERVDSVAAIVARFAPGVTGDVTLSNGELTVNAETGSESVREYVASSTAKARRAGLSLTDNIRVLQPAEDSKALQSSLDSLIAEIRQTVVFSSGESVLSPLAMKTLDKVIEQINGYSGLVIEIEGHTDDVGRAMVNEKLSQSRANAVREYLAAGVISANQLIAVGYGHRRPLESNDTVEGRQANRRVHFTVLKQPDGLTG